MSAPPAPRPAATVLLLRDAPAGYALFLVERSSKAAFMASAMVFPGGRLDPADQAPALLARCETSPEAAAVRMGAAEPAEALGLMVAAVRETFEEAGVLLARRADGRPLALDGAAEQARFADHRAALNAGERTFADIVTAEDLVVATERLVFFSHWITPEIEPKRYDTRFFATIAPADQRPVHDAAETTASAWMTPAAAVAAYEAGQIQLAPPTLRILRCMRGLPTVEAVLSVRAGHPPPCLTPRFADLGGELSLLLPGDAAFESRAVTEGPRDRIVLRDGRWHSEGEAF